MRILHTADWHLGQDLYGHDRSAEHAQFLDWLAELLKGDAIDALLIAGDVFDTANPSAAATRQFYAFLAKIRSERPDMDVIVTGGNHDGPQRLALPMALLGDGRGAGRLRIIGALPRRAGRPDLAPVITPLSRADGALGAVVAAIPFPRPGDIAAGTDALAALYQDAADAAAAVAGDAPVVLMGHLAVQGGAVSEWSERRVAIGGEETAPASIFPSSADYVALGHLHRPQTIPGPVPGPAMIRYSGSPLPLSATERDYRHSVTLLCFEPERVVTEIPVPRPAPFLRLPSAGAAPLEALEAMLAEFTAPDAPTPALRPFLELAVRLDGPAPDLRARLSAALGDAPVRLTRITAERPASASDAAPAAPEETLQSIQPEAMLERLHRERFETPPDPALLAAFRQLLAAVQLERDDPGPEGAP